MSQPVIVFTAEPRSEAPPSVWPVAAAAMFVLAVAAILAWRRARAGGGARRLNRILAAAVAGGGASMAMLSIPRGTAAEVYSFEPAGPPAAPLLAIRLLLYVLLAAMLVGTADLLFDALRPRRSLRWLIAGAPLFALFIAATFYATGSVGELTLPPTVQQAALVVGAVAAALIWWAWLPAPHREVGGIFE